MVFYEVAHLLRFSVDIVAVAFAARYLLKAVLAQVVYYFVTEDKSQLRLVLYLGHKAGAHEDHTLACGKGVDIGRLESVETQFLAQLGVVFEQSVGNALHHTRYGVAIKDTARDHSTVDLIRRHQHLVAVAQFAVVVVAHALFVEGVEFLKAESEV